MFRMQTFADYMVSNHEKRTLRADDRIIAIAPLRIEVDLGRDESIILRFEKHKDQKTKVLIRHFVNGTEERKCFEIDQAVAFLQEKGLSDSLKATLESCPFFTNNVFVE